jgi:bifunctional UDP-N-acetylglucosamine pyrophosphorylase / glucosamine-1-phosphate N-acetyltransferase
MNSLKPNNFFDLKDFFHNKLFENISFVYQALKNIDSYIDNFKKSEIFHNPKRPLKGVYIDNIDKVFLAKNVSIEPNTYIKGPCIIGENSQIRSSAYIRDNVIIGCNSIIGHATEIKNSILLNNAFAAHFNYVGDSIIGNNVNLGAGVKLANLPLSSHKSISFYLKDKKIDTLLNKLGAIIGDNSQIGCNSVLNPATFLEKEVICLANLSIKGFFFKNSFIKESCIPLQKSNIKEKFNEFCKKS